MWRPLSETVPPLTTLETIFSTGFIKIMLVVWSPILLIILAYIIFGQLKKRSII